jgi:hypothetical protein
LKTKLTNSILKGHAGYGTGSGIIELHEYECPCGKVKILEEHKNIPGFEEHYQRFRKFRIPCFKIIIRI